MRKTWNVINELTSRNSGKSTNILEIKVDNKIVSNPMGIAETINDHFTKVAQVLAQDIPVVDVNPESYLEPTDHSFSLQIPSVDMIPSKLLKWLLVSSHPLLPQYSQSLFSWGYIQTIGKRPK